MGEAKLGVVGVGLMGSGIAHVAALAGLRVVACDLDARHNARARAGLEKQLARLVERGKLASAEADAALARVEFALGPAALADCDAVIEAISEDQPAKEALFAALDAACPASTLLVTNTSSISVTALAGRTRHPERVVGMHFFNPVPQMKLVEVVRALQTDDASFERARALGAVLGKEVVCVKDSIAFLVNRTFLPFVNEAIFALAEGIGSAEDIDRSIKLGLNHPMGPLELCDLIGLDTLLQVMETMHRQFGESKYRPCPLLRKHVEAGWFGRKSGRGFYRYG